MSTLRAIGMFWAETFLFLLGAVFTALLISWPIWLAAFMDWPMWIGAVGFIVMVVLGMSAAVASVEREDRRRRNSRGRYGR